MMEAEKSSKVSQCRSRRVHTDGIRYTRFGQVQTVVTGARTLHFSDGNQEATASLRSMPTFEHWFYDGKVSSNQPSYFRIS